jgi:hypothetical protein
MKHEQPRMIEGMPEGMLEYNLRSSIRDFIRLYGFEEARSFVAEVLTREAQGKRQ